MAASLETNKILAALLTAGIFASGAGVVSRILYHPTVPEEPAYLIEVATEDGEGGEAGGEEEVPVAMLLANADAAGGETGAKKCVACHTFEDGGANKIGPNLYGILGRDIASVSGFKYSDALGELDGTWDYDALNAFLAKPKDFAPGTKMAYAGMKSDEARADLIMYLRSLAADPMPLPEAEASTKEAAAEGDGAGSEAADASMTAPEGAAEGAQGMADTAAETAADAAGATVAAVAEGAEEAAGEAGDAAGGLIAAIAAGDVGKGEKISKKCKACHVFDEGGKNKLGPALWGVVGRDIASHEGFRFSGALAEIEGEWTYDKLDQFLAAPKTYVPGTKMVFAGVKKEEDRAALLAYLRTLAAEPAPLVDGS